MARLCCQWQDCQGSRPTSPNRPYDHGDLRHALLAAALDAIDERGVTAMSLATSPAAPG